MWHSTSSEKTNEGMWYKLYYGNEGVDSSLDCLFHSRFMQPSTHIGCGLHGPQSTWAANMNKGTFNRKTPLQLVITSSWIKYQLTGEEQTRPGELFISSPDFTFFTQQWMRFHVNNTCNKTYLSKSAERINYFKKYKADKVLTYSLTSKRNLILSLYQVTANASRFYSSSNTLRRSEVVKPEVVFWSQ